MEKMTFRQKLENLWYHNKVAIIVVPIFLIFVVIATIQLFTKDKPDANFLYMGPAAIAFQGEGFLQESIATVMKEDYNNDGKKYVDYIELTALDPDDAFNDETGDFATGYTAYDVQKTVGDSFAAQIIAGDSMIYLLDEKYFGVAKDTNVLMPLSEALGYTPEFAINEYAVYLRDLDVYYMPGFKLLPESTLLCIRYPVTLTSGKTEVETREKCNISVFRDMFSYVYADKPEKPAEVLPVKTTLDEFKVMLGEYAQEKKVEISDEIIAGTADVAPEGFFEETGADLYKANGVTYLVYCGKIYVLGKHVGGAGLLDIEVFNFDNNDKNDIIFSYSYKNGDEVVSSLSVFNFTTMKETFLSVSAPMPLTLEKGENGKVEVYKASEETEGLSSSLLVSKNKGEHICTVFGDGKDVLIKAVG